MKKNSSLLLFMINDLLDFGRMGSDNLIVNLSTVDITAVVDEIIELFRL